MLSWRLAGWRLAWGKLGLGSVAAIGLASALSAWELSRPQPAKSLRLLAWEQSAPIAHERGAALFGFGDFGALDLDTLSTSALPWPVLAASLGLHEAGGRASEVHWDVVERAFKRFGFLYPTKISGISQPPAIRQIPLGLSVGTVTRVVPPIKLDVLNIGCSACHAGPGYRADGTPDPVAAMSGMPNTSLDLEAFSNTGYAALKTALRDEPELLAAIAQLFPDIGWRERLTLRFVALPAARSEIARRHRTFDRALPFPNGAPGLTNGVGALKHQLKVTRPDVFNDGAGFVSVPVVADRFWRSSLLADGAYAPKQKARFAPVTQAEMAARDAAELAAIASFFMVPSMGMTDQRAAAAIPELTTVMGYLRTLEPPEFPGPVDRVLAASGRMVYGRACSSCHGTYDARLDRPRLVSFPNWAGDVGTDRTRVEAFDRELAVAAGKTRHGQQYMDVASTGVTVAPLLTGLWASAPYFVNGSVPTIRHLLEPETRPGRFMVGGHRLDFDRLGIAGVARADGIWADPSGYTPYSRPAVIDTTRPGFSNRGHVNEVRELSAAERDALIEYLKLL